MNLGSKVTDTHPEALRLFVAISLPDEVRATFRQAQNELKQVLPPKSAAWTKPEHMHLTLRFLGNVNASLLPELLERLRSGLSGFGEINLTCERLGCFPDLRFPRVVWAWVHDDRERLAELHQRINGAATGFAEKPAEARFVGHVTLARPKQIKRTDAERLARFVEAAVERQFGAWRCGAVELIRSELGPQGSRYTTLDEIKL